MTDETVDRVARLLRVARNCEAPSTMEGDTIPCPFCHWGPDPGGNPHEETGCIWWAEKIIAEITLPRSERE
jgi:hypothetical protein